jgi:hypothetical protein
MSMTTFLARLSRQLRRCEGRADSRVPGLLLLVLAGVGGYVGWLYFVPYWNHRTLSDYVRDIAVLDAFEKMKPTEEAVQEGIKRRMRELGIRFDENSKEERLEVVPRTDLSFEVNLRYKETIRIYGMNPKIQWYEIHFDGTEMAKATDPRKAALPSSDDF